MCNKVKKNVFVYKKGKMLKKTEKDLKNFFKQKDIKNLLKV